MEEALLTQFVAKLGGEWCALLSEKISSKNKKTILSKHINSYTTKNQCDYFIHRNLEAFLNAELEYYLKSNILFSDDILAADSENVYKSSIQLTRCIKNIGKKIISLLAQIEAMQKALWLKTKFVLETNYCITLDLVPKKFHAIIAENEAQYQEWKVLYSIDKTDADLAEEKNGFPLSMRFLENNPHLLIDTKHYDKSFKHELLSQISTKKPLNQLMKGILLKGENFQALKLLSNTYAKKIGCIHIDPPYNTDTSGFLYKNNFKHSSWLTMMENRISESLPLLKDYGSMVCHVDENEYERLMIMMSQLTLPVVGTVIWDKRMPMMGGGGIARQHEYIIWASHSQQKLEIQETKYEDILKKAKEIHNKGCSFDEKKKLFKEWVKNNDQLSRNEQDYHNIDEVGNVYSSVSLAAPEYRSDKKFHTALKHPITGLKCKVPGKGFSRTPETLKKMDDDNRIVFGVDESTQPREKKILNKDKKPQLQSILKDAQKGMPEIENMKLPAFPFNHSTKLYKCLIGTALPERDGIVLDYFGGSGTTGHAVIDLNRSDKNDYKYILVEVGEHFNNILLPRIKKAVYSDSWKEGIPLPGKGTTHFFSYSELESFEDTLNSFIADTNQKLFDTIEYENMSTEYLLSYMFEDEYQTNASLKCESFIDPFNYKLQTVQEGKTTNKEVDLVETFKYLMGMEEIGRYINDGVLAVWGGDNENNMTMCIWRNCKEVTHKNLNEWYKSNKSSLPSAIACIYVNGDCTLKNVIDNPGCKVKLTELKFKQLMFTSHKD